MKRIKKMNKEKRKNILGIIIYPIIFIGILIGFEVFNDLNWIWDISMGLGITLLIYFAIKFKWIKIESDKDKEDSTKEFVKTIKTPELKKLVEDQKEFIKIANKEYDKRKDKSLGEKIGDEFGTIINGGTIIIVLGIMMFGGLAFMFGVNNEFINPSIPYNYSNSTFIQDTTTNSIEMVGDSAEYVIKTLFSVGESNPRLWFWLFWAGVFMFMILPILKIIYIIFSHLLKGGQKKNVYR